MENGKFLNGDRVISEGQNEWGNYSIRKQNEWGKFSFNRKGTASMAMELAPHFVQPGAL